MNEKAVVRCCDRTDHGGFVLEGYALLSHEGHQIAGLGHQVYCPRCNGIFPIVESTGSLFGARPALDGMRTACGARLIASQTTLKLPDDSPRANKDLVQSTPGVASTANAMPPPDDEASAASSVPPSDPVHVVMRIGVFHDGTGNNFTNSRKAMELCAPANVNPALDKDPDTLNAMMATCRDDHGMSGSSYAGGETNVHRLRDLYKVTDKLADADISSDGRRHVYRRVYIEGIGTEAEHPDSLWAEATGYGPTGVIARAEQAIQAVIAQIREFLVQNPNVLIDGVEFDLCGFSRGAAASRHFAYLLRHGGADSMMQRALRAADLPLKPDWGKDDITLRFIGLFDTVAAIGIPGTDNDDPVHLYLPEDCADTVVQLTARDECRLNFALNSIQRQHKEIALPGVHSDLGGGYAMDTWEHLILGQPETSNEPPRSDPKTSRAWNRAVEQAITYHWRADTLIDASDPRESGLSVHTWLGQGEQRVPNSVVPERQLRVAAAWVLKRAVRGEYQLVTLRIMHALAQQAGVPFKQSPDDVPALSLPDELVPIKDKLLAYAQGGGQGELPLTPDEERLLSRRYLHQSANWNPIGWKALRDDSQSVAPWGGELFFAMRPAPDRKRLVFQQKKGH